MGNYLMEQLSSKLSGNAFVKEVRGKGLIVGIECVEPIGAILTAAQHKGLLVISAGPNVIRLLPNLLVTKEEIDQAVAILFELLAEAGA